MSALPHYPTAIPRDPAEIGRTRRLIVAVAPLLVAAVTPLLLVTAVRHRLPGRAYTPDLEPRYAEEWNSWVVSQAVGPVTAAVVIVLIVSLFRRIRRSPTVQRGMAVLGWAFAAVCLSPGVLTVIRLLDVAAPPAPAEPWWSIPAQAVVFVLAFGLGWLLAGPIPPGLRATGRPHPTLARVPLADGERAVWTRSVFARNSLILMLFLLAAVAGLWLLRGRFDLGLLILVGCAVGIGLTLMMRVTVDGNGVTVRWPLLPRTRVHVPHVEISAAGACQLRGLAGMGLVGSERTQSYAVRGGEALSLRLADGREFIVTVDDAHTAAGLINAELDRQRGGTRC